MNRLRGLRTRSDRGAAVALFTISLTGLMAVAAFAVDVGLLFSERRQDQAAADSGVLAGALELGSGVNAASEIAASMVRINLPTSYTDAEWTALWASCTDPEALAQTGEVLGVSTQCISYDGSGTFRVKVPPQDVDTALLGVLGVQTLQAGAFAEASYEKPGVSGPIPFSVLGSAVSGTELCLRAASGGQSLPPCYGSSSGNFGGLEVGQYGDPAYGTMGLGCNLNKSDQLAINISVGVDHDLSLYGGTEVRDICDTAKDPNTLNTFQGISGGTFEGLISGVTVGSRTFDGLLTKGSGPTRELAQKKNSWDIDNVPLWDYIGLTAANVASVPSGCLREDFQQDYATNAANLTACLTAYESGAAAGFTYDPLFDYDGNSDGTPDIDSSVRFAIVPQFVESTFPNGNGWLHIRELRRVYLNDIYFGCNGAGNCSDILRPGESTATMSLPNGSSGGLDQVTGHLLPNSTLPLDLRVTGVSTPEIALSR